MIEVVSNAGRHACNVKSLAISNRLALILRVGSPSKTVEVATKPDGTLRRARFAKELTAQREGVSPGADVRKSLSSFSSHQMTQVMYVWRIL